MPLKTNSLIEALNADCALIFSPENRYYFTAFESSDGLLAVTNSGSLFFTDSRYIEAARLTVSPSIEVRESRSDVYSQLRDYLLSRNVRTIALEAERITVAQYNSLLKNENLSSFEFICDTSLDTAISDMRAVKDEDELERIKHAQKIAEDALDYVLGLIKPEMTERELGLELDFYMLSHGAQALSFETIAIAGKKTSMPHGVPGDNKIEYGDFVTMDFGAVFDGYHSDMTRTVAVGAVSDKQREIYNIVLDAQTATRETVRAGIKCSEADFAARSVITNAGYGEFFGHGTGHGVGIEIHESPNLSPHSRAVLREGNIVTDEPGIYLPGEFGVRIEDMLYVTADGCINLTSAPHELIVL